MKILKKLLLMRRLNKEVYKYLDQFNNLSLDKIINIDLVKIVKKYIKDKSEVENYFYKLISHLNFDRHVDVKKIVDDLVGLWMLTK